MFAFPKLVVLILVIAAVWIGYRWLNGPARELPRLREILIEESRASGTSTPGL